MTIRAKENSEEEMPTISELVIRDNKSQKAYPKNMVVMFSRYRYIAPLPTWSPLLTLLATSPFYLNLSA
jgi:hypothetical protein